MRLLTLILLVSLVFASVWAWFNVPGFPTAHDGVGWFALPGLCVVFVVFMYFMAELVERRPRLVAVPDKAAFEALPPERRRPVIAIVKSLLNWAALELVIVMTLVQAGSYRQNEAGEFNAFIILAIVFAMAGSPIVVITFMARIQSEIKRQAKDFRN